MGVKTLPFLVGFVALHLALILDVASIASPDWLVGSLADNATWTNGTANSTTKGLWALCWEDNGCDTLNETMQAGKLGEWWKQRQRPTNIPSPLNTAVRDVAHDSASRALNRCGVNYSLKLAYRLWFWVVSTVTEPQPIVNTFTI